MVNWKRILMPNLVLVLGFVMLWSQMVLTWFNFANAWSQRIYVIICLALISIGHGMTRDKMQSKINNGLLLFVVLNVVFIMFGGFAQINDALNGTSITEGSGIYMAYDVMSTPFTSKAVEFKIIVQTLIGTLPAIVLMFSVVSMWMADSPDEMQSAGLEFVIVTGMLVVFSFLGNLFGFAWVD